MIKNEKSREIENAFGIEEEEGFPLEKYWEIIKRRKNLLVYSSLSIVIAAMIRAFLQTPVYEAKGTLMIESDRKNMLMFADAYALPTGARDDYLNTRINILESRRLGFFPAEYFFTSLETI